MPYCRRLLQTDILPQKLSRLNWMPMRSLASPNAWTSTGHAESGPAQRIGHRALVAEVRQRDEHAVDLVAVRAEQVGAGPGVRQTLDGTVLGGVDGQRDDADAFLLEDAEHLGAPLRAEMSWKEAAIANDDAERD